MICYISFLRLRKDFAANVVRLKKGTSQHQGSGFNVDINGNLPGEQLPLPDKAAANSSASKQLAIEDVNTAAENGSGSNQLAIADQEEDPKPSSSSSSGKA